MQGDSIIMYSLYLYYLVLTGLGNAYVSGITVASSAVKANPTGGRNMVLLAFAIGIVMYIPMGVFAFYHARAVFTLLWNGWNSFLGLGYMA